MAVKFLVQDKKARMGIRHVVRVCEFQHCRTVCVMLKLIRSDAADSFIESSSCFKNKKIIHPTRDSNPEPQD